MIKGHIKNHWDNTISIGQPRTPKAFASAAFGIAKTWRKPPGLRGKLEACPTSGFVTYLTKTK